MAIDRTVQAIFDKAIWLINEQNESTGVTDTADTKEYRVRTIGILNTLIDYVFPASDTYKAQGDGKRAALPDLVDFTDEVDLDPMILRDVLPNGLAARLLSEENPVLANYFQQTFEEHLYAARQTLPADFESVTENADGLIEYGEFGHW